MIAHACGASILHKAEDMSDTEGLTSYLLLVHAAEKRGRHDS